MNDKKQYTLEELVNDSDFINWVRDGQTKASTWSTYGQTDEQLMTTKNQAVELIELIQFSEDEKDTRQQKEKIWSNISQSIEKSMTPKKEVKARIRPLYWIGAAAAACLLTLFMFNLGDSGDSIMTIHADQELVNHTLPDQSIIDITSGSSITYNKENWKNNRELTLDGEAFFNVEKGQTFTVKTTDAVVTVLGTSFNIKESDLMTEVICLTGKVKVVGIQSKQQQIITKNQSVIVEKTKVEKQNHSKIYVPWKETQYSFNDTKLADVFDEIQKSFDVTISYDEKLADEKFTGSFEKSSLKTALYNICWSMKLDHNIDGDKVSVFSTE